MQKEMMEQWLKSEKGIFHRAVIEPNCSPCKNSSNELCRKCKKCGILLIDENLEKDR